MNVALFGGTFDPIHRGHLAVARAARRQLMLEEILFVPSGVPPHKRAGAVTPFHDRHAMVVLATAGERSFVPSRLEDPDLVAGTSSRARWNSSSRAAPDSRWHCASECVTVRRCISCLA